MVKRSVKKPKVTEKKALSTIEKRKKKTVKDTPVLTKKKSSANLTWLLKVYKGLNDWHIPIFQAVQQYTNARHVIYPGSDKHITASLYFPSVVYIDMNKKLVEFFNDANVLNWINENKSYSEETKVKFLNVNFNTKFEAIGSFDLMISACAGIVSTTCAKYLKIGGYFLVSDAHFDARNTFLMPEFKLIAVYDTANKKLDDSDDSIKGHFITKDGKTITQAQVNESVQKPKSRRSFKLQKEEMFYLFKKIS